MAARSIVYNARTKAETEAINWGKVLAYAEKGISSATGASGASFDMVVKGDGGTSWYSLINAYGNLEQLAARGHAPDPRDGSAQPAKFDGTIVAPSPNPPDARMGTSVTDTDKDYVFLNNVAGQASRGVWMQSPGTMRGTRITTGTARSGSSRRCRTSWRRRTTCSSPRGWFVRAATSPAQPPSSTRRASVRGHLAPATAGDGATGLLDKLLYERHVELVNTGGIEHFDRRRMDDLQAGTARHLPVPAGQLEALSKPIYTFGGVGKPDMRIAAPNGKIIEFHSARRARGASMKRADW